MPFPLIKPFQLCYIQNIDIFFQFLKYTLEILYLKIKTLMFVTSFIFLSKNEPKFLLHIVVKDDLYSTLNTFTLD